MSTLFIYREREKHAEGEGEMKGESKSEGRDEAKDEKKESSKEKHHDKKAKERTVLTVGDMVLLKRNYGKIP